MIDPNASYEEVYGDGYDPEFDDPDYDPES